jgi:SNF2 family DNA or RNA helicase
MCDSWIKKKGTNPLTNRPVKIGSEIYNDIDSFCKNKDNNCLQIISNRNINPLTKKELSKNSRKAELFLGLCNKKASSKKASSKKASSKKASSKKASSKKVSSKKTVNCKDDEEINENTGRCVKKCKEDQERNKKTGRCIKIKGSKKASSKKVSSKKASSKKRGSKKRGSKKVSSKKASSKKRGSKKVSSKKRGSKKRGSKKVSSKKPVSKKVKKIISGINLQKEKINAIKESKKASDVEVVENNEMISPLQCTKYKTVTLKEHQKRVCSYIDKNPTDKGMILFHSVGSGKTITSITIIRCLLKHFPKKKVFVVTPKSLVDNFKKEVKKLGVDLGANLNITTHVKFINKIIEEGAGFSRNSIIIIDEAHNFRGEIREKTGKRAYLLMKATAIASHVFLLSATPIFNHPKEFSNLYCMISNNEKKYEEYSKIFKDYEKNQGLIRNMLKNKISYFKNEDTTEYPSVSYHNVEFEMTEEYFDMYNKIEQNAFAEGESEKTYFWANSIDFTPFYNGVRRAVNAVDEVIPTPKVEWVVKKIKEHIKANKKLLLYSNWLKSGTTLVQQRLREEGIPFEEIKGDMSIKQRTEAVNKYNSGEINLLSISSAGGEGLDLKETRSVIIMEPHWNNEKLNQVIGRAVRFRSHINLPLEERHVDIYHLILKKPESKHTGKMLDDNSIDEQLVEMGKNKDKIINDFYNLILDSSL